MYARSSRFHTCRPPEPNVNDHRIGQSKGSTTALEMSAHRLREAKKEPSKSVQQQLYEMVHVNGCLRQEVAFYRDCTERAHAMQAGAREVAQKMMLLSLFEVESPVELQTLAKQLQHVVDRYRASVDAAEEEWMSFWEVDSLSSEVI